MMDRCRSPKHPAWKRYGGRGIKVCERWQVFEKFVEDMGLRPDGTTLDRYPDNDGNYEPGNCRWATDDQQQGNRHNSVIVEYQAKLMPLACLSRLSGIGYGTLLGRYKRGERGDSLTRPTPAMAGSPKRIKKG